MSGDFAQRFCARFNVDPADYRSAVFRQTFYPQARLVFHLVHLVAPDFFAADRVFVDTVGRLTQRRGFAMAADEFVHEPANRRFLRRTLRLRVSVGRMQQLVNSVLSETNAPFVAPGNSPSPF
jgi:hypothetical protein